MNKTGALLIVLAAGLLIAGVIERRRDPFDIARLMAHPSASQEWTAIAGQALTRVTANTRYARRWQMGRMPAEGRLSLVLVDSDRLEGAALGPELHHNCTYTGADLLIVCDVALIRRFFALRDLDKTTENEFDADGHVTATRIVPMDRAQLRTDYLRMLEWILGHELGHILNGDGRAHFESDRIDDAVGSAMISQRRELTADAFLARQFGAANNDFYDFLIAILNNEIARKACPYQSPVLSCKNLQVGVLIFAPNDYLRYSTRGSHPEYIVRIDRLLILADERHNLGIIGPLAREIRAKLLKEGTQAPVH